MVCSQTFINCAYLQICNLTIKNITPVFFRYHKLPTKMITIQHRGVWATEKTNIKQDWMDMEQHISEATWTSSVYHQSRHIHKVLKWKGATIPRSRCVRSWVKSRLSASERWNIVPKNEPPDNTTLQIIQFASMSLTSAETSYSNIGREALGLLHGLQKFHHYCYDHEVSMITDHKPLVAISGRMWQPNHIGYRRFCCTSINKT